MPLVEGVGTTPQVFFRPMMRLKFLAALEKCLMRCRASFMRVRRVQSSANSSSVMSSLMVFMDARRH